MLSYSDLEREEPFKASESRAVGLYGGFPMVIG
jgi:hypothetical protein